MSSLTALFNNYIKYHDIIKYLILESIDHCTVYLDLEVIQVNDADFGPI